MSTYLHRFIHTHTYIHTYIHTNKHTYTHREKEVFIVELINNLSRLCHEVQPSLYPPRSKRHAQHEGKKYNIYKLTGMINDWEAIQSLRKTTSEVNDAKHMGPLVKVIRVTRKGGYWIRSQLLGYKMNVKTGPIDGMKRTKLEWHEYSNNVR